MSEDLKTILEAAYIIKERVTLESEYISVYISYGGDEPIRIHVDEKPDFITEYIKEPYDDKSMLCKAYHEDVVILWFEKVGSV